MYGNMINLGDIGGSPGKSSLFFLTVVLTPEVVYPEMGSPGWHEHPTCWVSGALTTILEKPRARLIHAPVRTYNRIRSSR